MVGFSLYLKLFTVVLYHVTRPLFGNRDSKEDDSDDHNAERTNLCTINTNSECDTSGTKYCVHEEPQSDESISMHTDSVDTLSSYKSPFLSVTEQDCKETFADEAIEEISSNHNTFHMYRKRRTMSAPPENRSKQMFFNQLKHKCVAEQLTLIMHDIYTNIPFYSVDIRNDYCTKRYTEIFNQLVIWIQYSIIISANSKQRAQTIKKWIKTCDHLLLLNNFHALVAVHCALRSSCVYSGKLKHAWFEHKTIIKRKHHRGFKVIADIVSYKNNFGLLRNKTRGANTPTLPYLGLFKRDCQYLQEYKNSENKIYELKERYSGYKRGEIKIKHDALVQHFILRQLEQTSMITMEDLYRMSDNVRDLDVYHSYHTRNNLIKR